MTDNVNTERVALVTGGTRGIGRAIVERLARTGWKIAFTYAGSKAAASEIVADLKNEGFQCRADQADVRDLARAQELLADIEENFGPVRLLVNNAGIKKDGALFRMKSEAWQDVIDTNLGGTFNYTRCVIQPMMKRRGGTIVNMVSISGIVGVPGQTNYSASKAAVIGLTKALAKEVARFGVRVNAVAPGLVETDMTRDMPEPARKKLLAQVPVGKMGTPEQIAELVSFLAEQEDSYITGQVIPIDGGMV